MVAVRRTLRPEKPAARRVPTLILSVETKSILLLDRPGAPTSSMAPALRAGYIATAMTLDEDGAVHGVLSAPITVDPGAATHHLANLAATQTMMRGELDVVGLIADDDAAEIVRAALRHLRGRGECERWIEVLDPGLVRTRLARLLHVLEPSEAVRDEILGGWDVALAFEPGAIDDVIGALRRRAAKADDIHVAAAEALIQFLLKHRARADYGTLRAQGIDIPPPARKHIHEHVPLRMQRSRCRSITNW